VESKASGGPGQPLIAANFDQGYENNAVSDRCPNLPFGVSSLAVDGTVTLYDQPNYQGNCKSFTNERVANLGVGDDDWNNRAQSLIVDGTVSLWESSGFGYHGGGKLFFTKVSAQPAPLRVSATNEIKLEGVVTDWWWNFFTQESAAGIKFDVILTENHSDPDAVRLMMELYIVRLGSGCWTWGGWPPGSARKCTLFAAPPTYFYRAAIDRWSEYVTRTIYPGEVMQWFINLKPLIQDACNDFSLNINNLYIAKISYTLEADGFLSSPSISCNLHRLRLSYTLPSGGGPHGGGECPTLFVWNGTDYVSEGVLPIHAESDITVEHTIQNTLALENGVYRLELRELDNYTSHLDQVKLYAVDYQGEWHLSPLAYANHSELGWVTWKLRFDDENRVDMTPTQTIALRFLPSIPYSQTAYFIFEVNGHNRKLLV
jgi:hypothetical protein